MSAVFDRAWSAFAVVWIVVCIKDLPALELTWFNIALASAAAVLAGGLEAYRQTLDRRASALKKLSHSA